MNRQPIRSAALALLAACVAAGAAPAFAQKPPPAPSKTGKFPKQRKPSPPPRIITIKDGQKKLAPGQLAKAPTVAQWQKTAKAHQEKAAKKPRPLRIPKGLFKGRTKPASTLKR